MYSNTDCKEFDSSSPSSSQFMASGFIKTIFYCFLTIVFISCSESKLTPYQAMVKEEVESGKRVDNLFEGLHFNMTRERFEDHSFRKNKEGIFYQHSGNEEMIMYIENDFEISVDFVFFPTFEREIIVGLSGYFSYLQWNAFRKELFAPVLQEKLVKKLEEWLGGRPFIQLPATDEPLENMYMKIDGNRHIILRNNVDNRRVELLITDLRKDPKYGKFYGLEYL